MFTVLLLILSLIPIIIGGFVLGRRGKVNEFLGWVLPGLTLFSWCIYHLISMGKVW